MCCPIDTSKEENGSEILMWTSAPLTSSTPSFCSKTERYSNAFLRKRRPESRRYKWLPGTWFMRVARRFSALSVIKSKDLFDHFSDPLHAEISKTIRTDKYGLSLVFVWFGIFYHRKSSNELNWRNSSLVSSTTKSEPKGSDFSLFPVKSASFCLEKLRPIFQK